MTTWLWPVSHKQRLFCSDSCFCSFRLAMVRDILRLWPLLFLPELSPYGERRLGLVCYVQRPSGSGALSLPPSPHPPNASCLLPHKGFAPEGGYPVSGQKQSWPTQGFPPVEHWENDRLIWQQVLFCALWETIRSLSYKRELWSWPEYLGSNLTSATY